ncbi:efflux RND transporter periplasmic adaptor subunit [Saccharicrinis sp. FJH62]|uniref:efflux RND transporter periplasmic adaptor subunit n=1 Tax=Saccharicrinis sp. FJH62 TaxID=3344657 RepID=UPI0035D3FD5C
MNRKLNFIYLILVLPMLFISCSGEEYAYKEVKKGDFKLTITETGTLQAVNKKSFVLPRYGRYWYEMKITGILDHGTAVKAGDSVIQLDPSEVKKYIADRKIDLETQNANMQKMVVQQQIDKSSMLAALSSEQATFELNKIEMESARFASENEQKVKELEFEQAKIRLEKTKRKLELADIQQEKERRIQEIRIERLENEIDNAIDILPKLTIRSPINGIFQVGYNRRTGELLKIGDEIYPGRNMGDVPDMTWMKVETVLNETDISKVKEGLPVKVKLDALDGVFFDGTITFISGLCHRSNNESRKKVFDVIVTMDVSDERLKPGMTVSCEYVSADENDVLLVPNECVLNEDGKSYVYVLKGHKPVKTEVETGLKNNSVTVLKSDLKNGARVVPLKEII